MVVWKTLLPVFIMICLMTSECTAQKETNNWFFGYGAGVDFSSGHPVFKPGGKINSPEGCASVSDDQGNLLFYSDGIRVWTRDHALMPASAPGLTGDTIASQSSLIVRYPGNTHLYYLFTVGSIENDNGNLSYSVIDMRLNNGMGDIVSKNILLASPVGEKITAIKHANANDMWIVTHIFNSNEFYVYYLNCKGLDATPQTFAIGEVVDGQIGNALGYIRGSTDGRQLAIANLRGNVQLFDFNPETGAITNPRTIGVNPGKVCHSYGLEFSPDSRLLYVSSMYNCGAFGEYNISQYSVQSSDINATKISLLSGIGNPPGALQLGPDEKIYIAFSNANYLGAINAPDTYGPDCGLVTQQVVFPSGVRSGVGLPNAVSGFMRTLLGKDSAYCGQFDHFVRPAAVSGTGYVWSNGASSVEQHLYEHGNYWLRIQSVEGCVYYDTLTITEKEGPAVDLGKDTSICAGATFTLSAPPADKYTWQDNSNGSFFVVKQSGNYYVEVEKEGCTNSDTIQVSANTLTYANLGPDQTICAGQEIRLDANAEGLSYRWSDGNAEKSRIIFAPGRYSVNVVGECATSSDEIVITEGSCQLMLPNAFTPGKAKNNVFRLANAYQLKDYRMRVYNRWGQLVFESPDAARGWDGLKNGSLQPAGTYVYIVSYMDPVKTEKIVRKGTVLLIP